MLERAYTRRLLDYPYAVDKKIGDAGWKALTTPEADMATEVPSESNGGITDGGKVYTFHIKQGVDWNTSPPRQVTASDYIREFKAFGNPVSPVGNPLYYGSTIKGLQSYMDAEAKYFADKAHKPTAANIANYQNTHNIAGLEAPDPLTLKVTLVQAWRLPLHDGHAVHLAAPGGVRQVHTEQQRAGHAHDLGRPVPDHLVRRGQVTHHAAEPGVEAVHRPAAAPVRQDHPADDGRVLGADQLSD